jgi:uncharacterized protein
MINSIVTNKKELRLKKIIIMLSPLVIIPIVYITAILFKPVLDVWTWVPVLLVYWVLIGTVIVWGGGKEAAKRWLKRPQGKLLWSVLPFIFVLLALPMFLTNWQYLGRLYIFIPWLIIGLVNPCLEEGYWRGLLMDSDVKLPIWSVILYSSVLFSLNHLSLGVTSIAIRNPIFLINTFVMGVVYSIVYHKTRSLRWPILAHSLMDLLGISVLCFLNIYIPPSVG